MQLLQLLLCILNRKDMPSPYPVLNNKPIDQWKVTELKDELKKRKLPLRGLKDELVRRLDEALREEMNSQPESENEDEEEEQVETPPIHSENREVVELEEDPPVQQEVEVNEPPPVQQEVEVNETPLVQQEDEEIKEAPPVQQELEVKEAPPVQQDQIESLEEAPAPVLLKKENTESSPEEELENPIDAPETNKAENSDTKMEERENIETIVEPKTDGTGVEPVCASNPLDEIPEIDLKGAEEVKPGQAELVEQVPKVGPDTGSQVKCESISSNESFKCINVENKLKDNLNADNFDLEKQVEVKQDIQDDKNKEPVKNQADTSLEGENYETPSNNINSIMDADSGSPEKLNLDRSSGDESMEEDLTESSKPPVESAGDGSQDMVKEEVNSENAPADNDKMDISAAVEAVAAPSEKRKLEGQEVAQNPSENFKRQRRWNTESLKVLDLPNLSSSSTPKDLASPVPPKSTFNRSDSNVSIGSPKERIVPASQKPATNSLRIDKFLRPFTLKAVQGLLGKTGSVSSFWMDHIKTHCYVTYSSVEEAIATRNAIYNLQWPPNGGNQLIVEFVDPQEVKQRLEAPPQSPAVAAPPTISPKTNLSTTPKASPVGQSAAQQAPFSRQNSTPRNQQQQVQLPPPPPLPAPGSGNAKPVRERLPPPPPLKKTDPQPAVVTLDDLFRKTKAVPRIYYLPLSEETVAAKLAARAKAAKE
ncbi:SAP domain containing protein [Carex littledalei]|uniref:SAP domain containing protein n=1 Tax=Carex littledalei TaxID=544730 RepID=A0A833QP10_9POAL|nr:SAP domain containing protein [Carex littledalei]